MKRTLLACAVLLTTLVAQAQIITFVNEPASVAGNKDFTWADPPDWGTMDLNDPLAAIEDTLACALDATAADSLACDPVISNVDGKIAVLWRGACEFGVKALNAQNAGAVGVIIINHSGAPVGMGAGAQGLNVTIPTIMVSTSDGAALIAAIKTGDPVVAFIGNKQNKFGNDLGMFKQDVFLPPSSAKPSQIAQDGQEFSSQIGAWVHNYGSEMQTGVLLNAEVVGAGSTYNETSTTPATIPSGDSVFVTLPDMALASYSGLYDLTYTITSDSIDEFGPDNEFATNFLIDNLFAYGIIDPATSRPDSRQFFRIADNTGGFSACIHFQDANASRLKATGLWTATTTPAADSLDGQIVQGELWRWDDQFADINDANLDFTALTSIATGDHLYLADDQMVDVYIEFVQEVALEDDVRYLFCAKSLDDRMFIGHEGVLDYDENRNNANANSPQPINLINDADDGQWNVVGFGTDVAVSVAAVMADNDVSVNEQSDLTTSPAYPNPAVNTVNIPLNNDATNGSLEIFDMEGRMVATQQVRFNGNTMIVDVTNINAGAYSFQLIQDNGTRQSFNVVVNK